MFSIDNFPPKNLSATNCFRQQKYFERVFWGTGRTFFFWLNEISTTKNMADTFSVAHISAVALSGTTSHPDLNSIETPRGGPPPPTHPWRSGKSVIDVLSWQVFDVYGCFCRKSRKNRPKTLQNRGPGPPKSSLEPSKTPFLQDI